MAIVLGFAPFIVFAIVQDVSLSLALWAAFASAFGIGAYSFLHTRHLRILDAGSTVIFGLLALYDGFIQPSLPVETVKLVVDSGLLALALASLAARQPLTMHYAREHVPWQRWDDPGFVRTNYVLTLAWTLAFAIMAAADAAAVFGRIIPVSLDMAAGLCTLAIAIIFTARYPVFLRQRRANGRS